MSSANKIKTNMLLHLMPRMFVSHTHVDLIDMRIEPFGLVLRNRDEIVVRHPYPNKRYFVACRKVGRTAVDGVYIKVQERVNNIYYIARWVVDASRVVVHTVKYSIVDDDFNAVTEDPILWSAFGESLGGWTCRYPGGQYGEAPFGRQCKIAMVVTQEDRKIFESPNAQGVLSEPHGNFETDTCGRIIGLRQKFKMPTVECDRLLTSRAAKRHPTIDQAFSI